MLAFMGVDALLGTDLAVGDDGVSAPGSIALLVVFVSTYGLLLDRVRKRG
jgi:hypothetical protein